MPEYRDNDHSSTPPNEKTPVLVTKDYRRWHRRRRHSNDSALVIMLGAGIAGYFIGKAIQREPNE